LPKFKVVDNHCALTRPLTFVVGIIEKVALQNVSAKIGS